MEEYKDIAKLLQSEHSLNYFFIFYFFNISNFEHIVIQLLIIKNYSADEIMTSSTKFWGE